MTEGYKGYAWSESDITELCRGELKKQLENQVLFEVGKFRCASTELRFVRGEAAVTTNKKKRKVVTVDFSLVLAWSGTHADRKFEGFLTIPSLADENPDSSTIEINFNENTTDEVSGRFLAGLQIKGRAKIQDCLANFWQMIREKWGDQCLTSGVDDPAARKRDLCRKLVAWMKLNLPTSLRKSWISGKALAARGVLTGVMTYTTSFIVGGPMGLAIAGAVMGGSYSGYKGYKFQVENFGEFTQAIMEVDRGMLLDMMGRFVDSPAAKGLTEENWHHWISQRNNQRSLLVHFCKELSDDTEVMENQNQKVMRECKAKLRNTCANIRTMIAPQQIEGSSDTTPSASKSRNYCCFSICRRK